MSSQTLVPMFTEPEPFGQTLEIGAHIDVPGLDLGGRGITAQVVPGRIGGMRPSQSAQQREAADRTNGFCGLLEWSFHQYTCTFETSPFSDTSQLWMAFWWYTERVPRTARNWLILGCT